MAEGGISQLGKFEMLNGNNYSIWVMRMKALLKMKGLYKSIIEKQPPPVNTDLKTEEGKTYQIWEEKNDETLGIIILSLSGNLVGMFTQDNNAKDVWEKLENLYAGNKKDRIIDCHLELKELKMYENETVDNYIIRATNIITKIQSLGGDMEMRETVFFIVRGINIKFENLALILRTRRDMTIDEVHQALREEDIRMEQQKQIKWPNEKALIIRERENSQQMRRDPIKTCYICKKRGHTAKNCWYRVDQKTQLENNHLRDLGRDKYNTNRYRYNAQTAQNTKIQQNKSTNDIGSKYKITDYALQSNTNYTDQLTENNMSTWNLDSGCSIHMTSDISNLTNIVEYQSTIGMAEADRSIEATAKGQMRMDILVNNKKVRVKMENILYVPKLRDNLLSVKELVKRGNIVTFNNEGAIITGKNGLIIAKAKEENNMYTVKGRIIKNDNAYTGINERENEQKIWHRRLGHLNINYLREMHKNNMIQGLMLKGKHIDLECEECTLGKLTQKPFKDYSKWKTTTRPLEAIHIDLCGPLPIRTIGGNQYIFVLVDVHTRMIFVEILKTKNEVYETFVNFKKQKENETGTKICRVRSDNGGEFVNKRLQELFNSEGIKHEKIVPYTPQSNGLAERTNRTLLDTARTMLLDSKLPGSFWGEAVATAAYLRNRSYRKGLTQTPIEMWSQRKPSANHLKIFGCLAYCWTPKPHRNKLEPRAIPGIMVGYSRQRKAYRIFIPSRNEIKESRNVHFHENKCGSEHLKLPNHMKPNEENNIEEIEYTLENSKSENNIRNFNETSEEEPKLRPQNNNNESEDEQETNLNQGPNPQTENESEEEIPENPQEDREMEIEQQIMKKKGRPYGTYKGVVEKRQQAKNTETEMDLKNRQVRRSERIKEKSNKAETENQNDNHTIIPNSYKEAVKTKEKEHWNKAMEEEMKSLKEHEVWDIVKRTQDMKVLKNKWVYAIKKDTDGKIIRYKARLVVKGNTQKKGIDYEETYAPVIKTESLRLMIALAARNNLHMTKFDIKTAYLYGTLTEETYMEIPEGNDQDPNQVCKLKKSLYGLPQSGRNWNIKLNNTLNEIGFQKLKCDPSIYIKRKGINDYIIIGTYVDDCMLISTRQQFIQETMRDLRQEFQMREEPGDGNFLGLEIQKVDTGYTINQTNQIRKILKKWKMEDCNPTKTPTDNNTKLEEYQDSPKIDIHEYQELIGSLSYISSGSRPDISFIVNKLSQFAKDPRAIHMAAGKRTIRYLKGTINLKLRYTRGNGKLEACSDASWSSTQDSKSQSGYCITLGNNLITWKAKKQDLVALSTCEAEINAICETVKELEWIKNVLNELGMTNLIEKPININTDSKSAIEWAKGQSVRQRTKHFDRKYYKIRDEIERNNISLSHKPGSNLEADILTKGVTEEKLRGALETLGLK